MFGEGGREKDVSGAGGREGGGVYQACPFMQGNGRLRKEIH
jgi:hypothetical protein